MKVAPPEGYPHYPYAIVHLPTNWAAGALQWTAAITRQTRDELEQALGEDVALQLLYAALDGRALPEPKGRDELDLSDYEAYVAERPYEVTYAGPSWLSIGSVAILRALQETGISTTELANRLHVRQTAVERLTDPFYFQHGAPDIRRVAHALNLEVSIRLVPHDQARDPDDPFDAVPTR